MVRSIDFKSALIGGFVVAMILCSIGAVLFAPSEYYGRFQIDTNHSHAFILDSATGQVWSEMFPDPQGGFGGQDPNFFVPKIYDEDEL
jgi:hypothetical protein